jgi:dihydrofolate reductase
VLLKSVDDIKKLKETDGGPIKIHGSGKLAQTLFEHGLVDEFCLMTFPIVLGKGKHLFNENAMATAFTMTDKLVTTNGVILAYYKRDGDVKVGTIGA